MRALFLKTSNMINDWGQPIVQDICQSDGSAKAPVEQRLAKIRVDWQQKWFLLPDFAKAFIRRTVIIKDIIFREGTDTRLGHYLKSQLNQWIYTPSAGGKQDNRLHLQR